MALLIRALHFSAGLQKFTIVFIIPLICIAEYTNITQGETVQTRVCATFPVADVEMKGNQLAVPLKLALVTASISEISEIVLINLKD